MQLNPADKFFIQDNEGNMILVTELDLNADMIKNGFIEMKGIRFCVDYEKNKLDSKDEVNISVSFNIEDVYPENDS